MDNTGSLSALECVFMGGCLPEVDRELAVGDRSKTETKQHSETCSFTNQLNVYLTVLLLSTGSEQAITTGRQMVKAEVIHHMKAYSFTSSNCSSASNISFQCSLVDTKQLRVELTLCTPFFQESVHVLIFHLARAVLVHPGVLKTCL